MTGSGNNLVFVPLGGVGEIGMNLALYGYGAGRKRQWIVVDFGVSFGDEERLPGIDLIMPDIRFLEAERGNVRGIVLTHAHEDHFGALIDLWPRLKLPVYATPFTANLLEAKCLAERGAPKIPVEVVPCGGRIQLPPFDIEFIPVAHSIPEAHSLAIRTPAGTVIHTGDWKIDPTPVCGPPTDEARFRAIGAEGVTALIADSTNAVREGVSPSEREVAATLSRLVASAKGRVAVTTFASNVGRIRAVAQAARETGRETVLIGRAMERVVHVARETGHLEGIGPFRPVEAFERLPANKVVALCTGSQGEPRAALARIAANEHPTVKLGRGDLVIFSSRTIPGNEKAVGTTINGLVDQGIAVITDGDEPVHVSGHPRRGEMRQMMEWLRPQLVVPVHGESLHLSRHAALAREVGVPQVLTCRNGDVLHLSPGTPGIVGEVEHGRLYKDGFLLERDDAQAVVQRRRMAYAGVVFVALAITDKGALVDDPVVETQGLPDITQDGSAMVERLYDTVIETFDTLPRPRRRDPDAAAESIRRAVRAAAVHLWGKKPICIVRVISV